MACDCHCQRSRHHGQIYAAFLLLHLLTLDQGCICPGSDKWQFCNPSHTQRSKVDPGSKPMGWEAIMFSILEQNKWTSHTVCHKTTNRKGLNESFVFKLRTWDAQHSLPYLTCIRTKAHNISETANYFFSGLQKFYHAELAILHNIQAENASTGDRRAKQRNQPNPYPTPNKCYKTLTHVMTPWPLTLTGTDHHTFPLSNNLCSVGAKYSWIQSSYF